MIDDKLYDADSEIEKLSKINAAGLMNLTMKDLWDKFYRSFGSLQYHKANIILDCIWIELGGDVIANSPVQTDFDKIELAVAENFSKFTKKVGFEQNNIGEEKTFAKHYRLLIKKAVFLRRLQNKQGKGTAYVNEEDDWE